MIKNMKTGIQVMAFAALIVLLHAGMSFAEPPLLTEEAETLDKGEMQFELSGEFSKDKETVNEVKVEEWESEVEARFILGIIDDLELELEVPYERIREKESSFEEEEGEGLVLEEENFRAHGYGDAGLALKWRFYNEDDLSFALSPSITFPTGNEKKELGTGRISEGLTLIGSKEFDPIHLEIHMNVGIMHYNFKLPDERAEARSNIWNVSLAATKRVAKLLTACADIGIQANPDRHSSKKPAYFLAGFVYSATKHLDLSLGAKVGLTKPEPDLSILPGLVWSF